MLRLVQALIVTVAALLAWRAPAMARRDFEQHGGVFLRQNRTDEAPGELRAILNGRPDRATAGRARAFLRDLS